MKTKPKKHKTFKNIATTKNFRMKHLIQIHEITTNAKTCVSAAKNTFGTLMEITSQIRDHWKHATIAKNNTSFV